MSLTGNDNSTTTATTNPPMICGTSSSRRRPARSASELRQLVENLDSANLDEVLTTLKLLNADICSASFEPANVRQFYRYETRIIALTETCNRPELQLAALYLVHDLCLLDRSMGRIASALVANGIGSHVKRIVERISALELDRVIPCEFELLEVIPLFLTTFVDKQFVPNGPRPVEFFDVISSLLEFDSADVRTSACYWLYDVGETLTELEVKQLGATGAAERLIRIIRSTDALHLLNSALMCFSQAGLHMLKEESLIEYGLPMAINRVMRLDNAIGYGSVVEEVFEIIDCSTRTVWIKALVKAGLLDAFIQLLLSDNSHVVEVSANGISRYASDASEIQATELVESGILNVTVGVIDQHMTRPSIIVSLLNIVGEVVYMTLSTAVCPAVWQTLEELRMYERLDALTRHEAADVRVDAGLLLKKFWTIRNRDLQEEDEDEDSYESDDYTDDVDDPDLSVPPSAQLRNVIEKIRRGW